jgi:hypothetical protein
MPAERCTNQNHSKMNVTVRFCAACGEIVNKNVKIRECSDEEHARSRKERNHYCINCGKDLKAALR